MMKLFTSIFTLLIPFLLNGQSFKVYDEVSVPELNRKYQIGREYPEGYEVFVFNYTGRLYEIKEGLDKTDKNNITPSNLIIRALDKNDNIIKDNIIVDNDIDSQYASFGEMYIGIRNFVIIQTRFYFAILNLSTNKLIIPNYSTNRPEFKHLGDAQSGNISIVRIFDDGQYVVLRKGDFGFYCLNLLDIHNPISVEAFYTVPPRPSYFFFLDHRKYSIYNGICVKSTYKYPQKVDTVNYLFKGLRFQQQNNDSIIRYDIDNQYLLLKQYNKEDNIVDLVIDYKNGQLLDYKLDKDLINRLLKRVGEL